MPTYVLDIVKRTVVGQKVADLVDLNPPASADALAQLTRDEDTPTNEHGFILGAPGNLFKFIRATAFLAWLTSQLQVSWDRITGKPDLFPPDFKTVRVLPDDAVEGRLVWLSQPVARSWQSIIAVPTGETEPTGVGVTPGGNLVVVGRTTDKVYQPPDDSTPTWDGGLPSPAGSSPSGVAVAPNGDVLISDTAGDRVYRHDGNDWDGGISYPVGEDDPRGIAFNPNDQTIALVGEDRKRIYIWDGDGWESSIHIPASEVNPQALEIAPNGDILLLGRTTGRIFRYSNGAWDAGLQIPSGETRATGVALTSTGDILLVGQATDKMYRYSNGAWDGGVALTGQQVDPVGVAADSQDTPRVLTHQFIWAVGNRGSVNLIDNEANGIVALDDGTIAYTGNGTKHPVNYNPTTGTHTVQGSGDRGFVTGLARDSSGNYWNAGSPARRLDGSDTGIQGNPGTNLHEIAFLSDGDLVGINYSNQAIYRYDFGTDIWSSITTPALPGGVDEAADGDFVIVGYNSGRVYRRSGSSWDSGIEGPTVDSGTTFTGIAIADNDDLYVILSSPSLGSYMAIRPAATGEWSLLATRITGLSGSAVDLSLNDDNHFIVQTSGSSGRFYTHDGSGFDTGIQPPKTERNMVDVAVKGDGAILVLGTTTRKIYEYRVNDWHEVVAIPTAESSPTGLAIAPNGDLLITGQGTDRIYRYNGTTWDAGLPVPAAETSPQGIDVAPDGDIVLIGRTRDRVYRYNGTLWDSGVAGPVGESAPTGVALNLDGEYLVVGAQRRVYRHSSQAWDTGFAVPSAELSPQGVAVKPNGQILLVGQTTGRFYEHDGAAWNTGTALPAGEGFPTGIAVATNGDILIVGSGTDRIYRHNGASWDSGLPLPPGEIAPAGVAVNAAGHIIVIGDSTNKVYTYDGDSWDAGLLVHPSEVSPRGVTVKPNGQLVIVGTGADRIFQSVIETSAHLYLAYANAWHRVRPSED